MKGLLTFILMTTLVLIEGHSVFSMEEKEEEISVSAGKRRAPSPHEKEDSPSKRKKTEVSDLFFTLMRTNRPLGEKVAAFSKGGEDLYNDFLTKIPSFSDQVKENICSDLIKIAEIPNLSAINHIRAAKLVFNFGTPEQNAQDFSVGNQNLWDFLDVTLKNTSEEKKNQICLELTEIPNNPHISPVDRMRSGDLLLKFGTLEQKSFSFCEMKKMATDSTFSPENHVNAAWLMFDAGTPEQKAEAFSVGDRNLWACLDLTLREDITGERKEKICSDLKMILSLSTKEARLEAERLLSQFEKK